MAKEANKSLSSLGSSEPISFAPLELFGLTTAYPRLAPWAALFGRYAAGNARTLFEAVIAALECYAPKICDLYFTTGDFASAGFSSSAWIFPSSSA